MTMFLILALIFGLVIGGFFALMFTSSMRGWKKILLCVIIMALVGSAISAMFCLEAKNDTNLWNNGTCAIDGAEWRFTNAEHIRNSGTSYFYCCDECGRIIQLHSQQYKN